MLIAGSNVEHTHIAGKVTDKDPGAVVTDSDRGREAAEGSKLGLLGAGPVPKAGKPIAPDRGDAAVGAPGDAKHAPVGAPGTDLGAILHLAEPDRGVFAG